ncbi:MAG TPA: ATP-binding protein [Chryseolinea sp.]
MLKQLIAAILLMLLFLCADAQTSTINSLLLKFDNAKNDTSRLVVLRSLTRAYSERNPDSANYFAEESLKLARMFAFRIDEGGALQEIGYALLNKQKYPRALQSLLEAKAILEDSEIEKNIIRGKFEGDDEGFLREGTARQQRLSRLGFTFQLIGLLYANANNFEKARKFYLQGLQVAIESGSVPVQGGLNYALNRVYLSMNNTDSALLCIKKAYDQFKQSGLTTYLGGALLNIGRTYLSMRDTVLANDYFRRSAVVSKEYGYSRGYVAANLLLADYFIGVGTKDSALNYVRNAEQVAKTLDSPELFLRTFNTWARYYSLDHNSDSLVKYQALIIKVTNDLFNTRNLQQFENIDFQEQQKQLAVETAQKETRDTWRMYLLLSGLFIILIIAGILWRNNRQRRIANEQLSMQKDSLESTLSELKSAQSRLIHSEKMASLGELTAASAHEIQNPLNFVNNFSEVNKDLVQELRAEAEKGNLEDVKAIAENIESNSDKINHHGKRADSIVKGMLQHSHASSAQKELTNINRLAEEYFRLAITGHRAKDKSFNVGLEKHLEASLPEINVVPQDIGRVLLNLINNALYSVKERARKAESGYEPVVSLSTRKAADKIEVRIKDNGTGIPGNVLQKIFQPFFTTKPTGQGTGLGLSVSYDIVKAHGGELKVETAEGQGCEFIILLPRQ